MLNVTTHRLKVSLTLENGSTIYLDYTKLSLVSVPSEVLKTLTYFFKGLYCSMFLLNVHCGHPNSSESIPRL